MNSTARCMASTADISEPERPRFPATFNVTEPNIILIIDRVRCDLDVKKSTLVLWYIKG